ncbi:MAG: hypothetical protein ABL874_06600 [Sphingopyxis sp.]
MQIARYLDGEMDAATRTVFEAELEHNPELAVVVAQWRVNDTALQKLFAGCPVDEALIARLGLGSDSAARSASIIDFAAVRAKRVVHAPQSATSGRWVKPRWIASGAIAAALALAVSIKMMTATPGLSDGPAFQLAMQQNITGQSTPIGDSQVVPVLSFAANDGRFCREYRVEGAASMRGITCRDDRRWTTEAEVSIASAPDATGIVAASGEASAVIDTAYVRLRGGDPLNAAQERAAIIDEWQAR